MLVNASDQIDPLPGHYRTGDYVVGSFSPEGKKEVTGQTVGNEEARQRLREKFRRHVMAQGGVLSDGESSQLKKTNKVQKTKKGVRQAGGQKDDSTKPAKYKEEAENADTYEPGGSSSVHYTTKQAEKRSVLFISKLGKVKVMVLGTMECDGGVGLVFESEDDIAFEPAPGEELTIKIGDVERRVFYPGLMFSWFNGEIRVMIFLNSTEEK